MDGTELDEIMNEAPASEVIPAVVDTPTQAETQPRDETGKFATKAQEAPTAEVDPDNAAQHAVEGGEHDKGRVPVAAVQAEREKAKTARDEAETLRQQVAKLSGQVDILTRQQPAATPAEKEKPKATIWTDPDSFLAERLSPVTQQIQQQHERTSRLLATQAHGAETVQAAYQAMGEAIQANPATTGELQRIMAADHPYDELVKWHQKSSALAEIGEDPTAYRTRIEAETRAAILAEYGIEVPTTAVQQPAPSAPTTTKPLIKLPQSLNRIPGAGNSTGAGDTSDAGLFTDAMSGR